jgi:hypothetical protein
MHIWRKVAEEGGEAELLRHAAGGELRQTDRERRVAGSLGSRRTGCGAADAGVDAGSAARDRATPRPGLRPRRSSRPSAAISG